MTEQQCGLCGQDALASVYRPDGSTRGLSVHLCAVCGLVQSTPRRDRAPRAGAHVSGGADWGNVRYGKGFRTDVALEALARHADLRQPLHVLDVGSNRGSFAQAFLAAAPRATLDAVEPDERFAASCMGMARTSLRNARIEDVSLPDGVFDIVHSCHTLEHLADPARVLADHARCLKPGGLLFLDVPNLALIGGEDILEEWFIDKHLYHFTARTLARMVKAAGFDIVEGPDLSDPINLFLVARKTGLPAAAGPAADPGEVAAAETLIARYIAHRARNMAALTLIAARLAGDPSRRVAIWGAGRLFDNLVLQGGFDPKGLHLLIDAHLKAHVPARHGVALQGPEALRDSGPDLIVIMSRGFAGEIAAQAAQLCPRADILTYGQLLKQALGEQAARAA